MIDLRDQHFSSDGYWEEDEWQAARHLVAILWPDEPVRCPWRRRNKSGDEKSPDPATEKGQPPAVSANASNEPLSGETTIQSVHTRPPVELSATQINLMKQWLHKCNPSSPGHESCRREGQKSSRGMRVIDVTKWCVVAAPSDCRYVTLSYVWGGLPRTLLLRSNSQKLMSDGGLKDPSLYIPRAIHETILLCQQLQERYLWVDALCIQQDDPRDKLFQIQRMDRIYGNAMLTIIAATGSDADTSLVSNTAASAEVRDPPHRLEDHVQIRFAQSVQGSRWATRGWTFQEMAMSLRSLVFTQTGVYFHCQAAIYSEKGQSGSTTSPQDMVSMEKPGRLLQLSHGNQLEAYFSAVQAYSRRHLSLQADADKAFKGIMRIFGSTMDNVPNNFMHGLPTCAFDQALCWTVDEHRPDLRRPDFPSWSWQGWAQQVFFAPELYANTGRDSRTNQVIYQQWSAGSVGHRLNDSQRPAVWSGMEYQTEKRRWGFPVGTNISSKETLCVNVIMADLEVAQQPKEERGCNAMYDVYSCLGRKRQFGSLLLHKQWRAQQPSTMEFFPISGIEKDGYWTITHLMCIAEKLAKDGKGHTGFERVQILRCSIDEDDWVEAGPKGTHLSLI